MTRSPDLFFEVEVDVYFFGNGLASGDVDQDGLTDIWVAGASTTVSLLLGKYIQ